MHRAASGFGAFGHVSSGRSSAIALAITDPARLGWPICSRAGNRLDLVDQLHLVILQQHGEHHLHFHAREIHAGATMDAPAKTDKRVGFDLCIVTLGVEALRIVTVGFDPGLGHPVRDRRRKEHEVPFADHITITFNIGGRLARQDEGHGMQSLGFAQGKVHLLHGDRLFPAKAAASVIAQHIFQLVPQNGFIIPVLQNVGQRPADLTSGGFMPCPYQQQDQMADKLVGYRTTIGIFAFHHSLEEIRRIKRRRAAFVDPALQNLVQFLLRALALDHFRRGQPEWQDKLHPARKIPEKIEKFMS